MTSDRRDPEVLRSPPRAAEAWKARPASATWSVRASWSTILLAGTIPAILWTEFAGPAPAWLTIAQIAIPFALLVATILSRRLRALWRFALTMCLLLILIDVLPFMDLTVAPMQSVFGATPFDARMQAEQTAKLLVALLMITTLLLTGLRSRDLFLRLGSLTAPIRPVPLLGFPHADSWRRFGLIWGFGIAGALGIAQYVAVRPTATEFAAIVPMIPSIIFYAALNAFSEEMTYRAPMLATLEPAVGSSQALWQSAVLFGVAHYFGTPGGLLGAMLSIFMGWILGKAMLETRGLFWAWWIHFLSDVVIFVFIALALVA
jgi:membrane protease YdiL (CAAX protease family)